MTTALTLYGTTSVAATASTGNQLAVSTGGTSVTRDTKIGITNPLGWGQLYSQGNTSNWPNLSAMGDPDSHGWYLEVLSLVGQQINQGNWTPTIRLQIVGGGSPNITANLFVNAYVYNSGIYTPIGTMEFDTQSLTSSAANHTFPLTFMNVTDFFSGDILYVDCWPQITTATGVSTANSIRITLATGPTTGIANDFSIVTPGYQVQTAPVIGTIWPTLTIASMVLQNLLWNAWNPLAAFKGKNTALTQSGGLYINYQYNDPSIVNVQGDGVDSTVIYLYNHDPLTCVRYLQNLAHYLQSVPGDRDVFDTPAFQNTNLSSWIFHIAQLDVGTFYSTPKGFVYFSVKMAGELLNNHDLLVSAHATANNFMRSYRSGYFWTFKATGATYSVNDTSGCCAAVLDVALRYPKFVYNNPSTRLIQAVGDFIAAAKSGMDHIINACRDTTTGLCFDTMIVSYDADGSHDTPVSIAHHSNEFNSRASTSTEVAEHLLRMYLILNNPAYASINPAFYDPTRAATYKTAAYAMLNETYTLMWDTHQSGFFVAIVFTGTPPGPYTTSLSTAYKETRATSAAMRAYCQSAQIDSTFSSQLAACVSIMSDDGKFLKTWGDWWGYVYRVNPDFSFYITSPGQGVGNEDQLTSEAMGSSVDALLQAYAISQAEPIVIDNTAHARNGIARANTRNGQSTCQTRNGKTGNVRARNGKVGAGLASARNGKVAKCTTRNGQVGAIKGRNNTVVIVGNNGQVTPLGRNGQIAPTGRNGQVTGISLPGIGGPP